MLGGIVTTVNPLYTPEELAFQLRDTGATYHVTVPPFPDKAREAARGTAVREIFVFGESEHATPFAALLASDGDAHTVAIDPREDLVALPLLERYVGAAQGA